MCFHYALSKKAQEIENRFKSKFDTLVNFSPIYHANGFNNPAMPVITNESPNKITMFNWGLIPNWIKSRKDALSIQTKTLNAKSETIFEKPSFKFSIEKKRCLVLSDGFYEWKDVNNKKYPYFISLKNQELFAMAGIWEAWIDKNDTGEIFNTFSILTTEANPFVAEIHSKKRMPVILLPEAEEGWLSNNISVEQIKSLTVPFKSEMEAYTISRLISSKTEKSNVPEVQKHYDYS